MPRTLCLFFALNSMLLSPVLAIDDLPPPGEPPEFWRASISDNGDEMVVLFDKPTYKAPRKPLHPEVMEWERLRPALLGKTTFAFTSGGKLLEKDDVLARMPKPTRVVVFLRSEKDDLKRVPDQRYLEMLNEKTLVMVVEVGAVAPLIP
jgi:hypothetical protein